MSGETGVTVVTTLVRFFLCVRGCGRIVRPAFPAPSNIRGTLFLKLGRTPRRGIADSSPTVIVRLDRTIQYSRGASDGVDRPRRTGYPLSRVSRATQIQMVGSLRLAVSGVLRPP